MVRANRKHRVGFCGSRSAEDMTPMTHAAQTFPPTAEPILAADRLEEFAAEVRAGLTRTGQKELPSKYLYDDIGSALFEVISVLPQYGLTRADERLLRRNAHDIVDRVPDNVIV